ncbi:MAG: nitroreductase family protein [Proteobacteria bacterium]|nr:nitroreductase family protein [Pseudomonadota bacterium]
MNNETVFHLNKNKCSGDGLCVNICPMNLLEFKEGEACPSIKKDKEKVCIKCGHCLSVCPHFAISIDGIDIENCPPIKSTDHVEFEKVVQLLRGRRSIRQYKDQPVEPKKITKLLDLASTAPTAGNSQQVGWLVIASKKDIHKLSSMTVDMLKDMVAKKHPMSQTYSLSDLIKAFDNGYDVVLREAPCLVIAHVPKNYPIGVIDCSIALTYLDLAAPSLGLGSCWAGFLMMAIPQWEPIQKYLNIPEGNVCCGAMMLGYPKYKYQRMPFRKKAKIIWK